MFFTVFFFNVYLFLRESVPMCERGGGRGRERGRQRIRNGPCTDSREPDMGLEPMNHEIMA